jgi:hypothetical protein
MAAERAGVAARHRPGDLEAGVGAEHAAVDALTMTCTNSWSRE